MTASPTAPAVCWSPADDARLRESYGRGGIAAARAALPDRTVSSIYHRTQRLRVMRRKRWTRADNAAIREHWGDKSLAWIARELGRTELAIYYHAHDLGFQRGIPQGYEAVRAAAKRVGFSSEQLRKILRAAGVNTSLRLTPSTRCKGQSLAYVMRYVDPDSVDRAVIEWLATEEIEPAARARGMCGDTLRAILVRAGYKAPKRLRQRWRVASAAIDAAVAAYRSTDSIRQHALRLGIVPRTLSIWLQAAGAIPKLSSGVGCRVARNVVDRVVAERAARKECRWPRRAA